MKSFLATFLFLFLSISSFAQLGGEDEVYLSGDMIEPKFNGGGLEKFYEFANKEIDFSKFTKSEKILASFTVDKNGDLKNIKVIQFDNFESATEIMRVLTKSPKWKPAQKGGNPVAVTMKFPFDVKLKNNNEVSQSKKIEKVASDSTVEKVPEYSGGLSNFYKFIAKNYREPDQPGLNGKVIVSFVVEVDGSLSNFVIDKDLGFGTGKEAIRVLKKSPKWTPATQNGVPVRATYSLPILITTPK
ncbi:energy transducer TonB [Flavobacterium sp.]|uniref:energy transducer TonB n=1 Tax=Flavobacterium sp. TaxID=239 RepID=UPI000ED2ED73|nr:energy transducer TonB [Flavobacterium sp.]HCQ13054.1 hypothetical protein [Flavobacterium sp.]